MLFTEIITLEKLIAFWSPSLKLPMTMHMLSVSPSHLGVKTREKIVYATCKPVFAASMEFSPCPCHLQRPPAGRTADAILLLLRINSIASHFGLQKDDYLTEHYQLLSFLASSEQ
jgi:hypothetical protein